MQLIKLAQKVVPREDKGKSTLYMCFFLSPSDSPDGDEVITLFGEYVHVEAMRRIPRLALCEVSFETKLRYGRPSQELTSIKPASTAKAA